MIHIWVSQKHVKEDAESNVLGWQGAVNRPIACKSGNGIASH